MMFRGIVRRARLGVAIGCVSLMALTSCYQKTLSTQNYEVMAVLDGPNGRVVGSTVIRTFQVVGQGLEDGRYHLRMVQGTGIPLRFPDGHYLFTTFYGEGHEYQHNWNSNYPLWEEYSDDLVNNGHWVEVSKDMTPKIIGFRNLNDPKTVYVIDNGYSKEGVDGYPTVRFFIKKTNAGIKDSLYGIIPWVRNLDNYLSGKNGARTGNLEENANIDWIYRGMKNVGNVSV